MRARLFWIAALIGPAAGAGHAQQRSAEPDGPPEIVVTGERVPRSLLETPSSVVVTTAEMIDAQAADRVDDLLAQIPNVQLGSGGQGPTIRGQDSTGVLQDLPAFLGGNRPRVTLQVDGRAVSYNEFVYGVASLWDVAQVELFRSPQTTTQGRNSIGGAIFVQTSDPTYAWKGRARAIAGDFDTRQGSAVVSGPIVADQLAFRLAGDIRRSRTTSHISGPIAGADPNRDANGLARLKLLAEPRALPGARLELTYLHVESKAPQLVGVRRPFESRRDPRATYGVFATNVDSLTGVLDYALTPTLGAKTTLSRGDAFVRRFAPPGLGQTQIHSRDFSTESVLSWQLDGSVRLLAGAHRSRTRLRQAINLSAVIGTGDFTDTQNSLGLFGETTLRLVPSLAITAGLRYQRDTQDRTGSLGPPSLGFGIAYDGRFDAWLPKLSVAYDIADDVTAGILVQRAFNPGGIALNFDTGEQDSFEAETLWNYEAFARASLAGGRIAIAANAFYNDIRDAQRPQLRAFTVPGGATAFWAEIDNAPAAESYGFELEVDWRASHRLSVRAGLGLLETRIIETIDPADPNLGKDFQRSPKLSASSAIDWRPIEALRLSAQLRHHSGYFSNDANTPALRIDRSTVLDARAAYSVGPITLFGYARNLLDDFHMAWQSSRDFGVAGDPRQIGVGLEARF